MTYPVAEGYRFPHTPTEVINDELHFYRTPPEYRGCMVLLAKIYAGSPLHNAFTKYAILMSLAERPSAQDTYSGTTKLSQEQDFFAGEILSMHSLVRPLPYLGRRAIVNYDPAENLCAGKPDADPENEVLQFIIKQLGEFRDATWQECLEAQDVELQTAIIESAVRLYGDLPNVGDREDSFCAGYMFGATVIQSIADGTFNT